MNIDNFIIDSNDIELAQSICAMIMDDSKRNRAMANAIAASIATKYFDKNSYDVDTNSGLHNIGKVLEDIDISDIYIDGNYIDVRVLFNNNEICVPSSQTERDLLPVSYMFIKINDDLSNAKVIGFLNPNNINTSNQKNGYYYLNEDDLETFENIEILLINQNDKQINDKDIFAYIDNNLEDKNKFYLDILKSKSGRLKLAKAFKAQQIFEFVSINSSENTEATNDEIELTFEENGTQTSNSIDNDDFLTQVSENIEDLDDSESLIIENNITESPSNEILDDKVTLEYDSNFSTVTTPSLNDDTDESDDDFLSELSSAASISPDAPEDITADNNAEPENSEQIEALFDGNTEETDKTVQTYPKQKRKSSLTIPLCLLVVLALTAGLYWGYSKYLPSQPNEEINNTDINVDNNIVENTSLPNNVQDAMPVESVENTNIQPKPNEVVSTSIPAIEQNLDASILVSNLKVEWEVPTSYTSNTSAKRYLMKLGKIIQLNLKTELLLLNKPPITNKIEIEIKYNNNSHKFETAGVTVSSGESSVDRIILDTVNKVLVMNLNINTDSFAKLQGNPVLRIRL